MIVRIGKSSFLFDRAGKKLLGVHESLTKAQRQERAIYASKNKRMKEQLKIGTKVEMEHTNDRKIARNIAIDHLEEDPSYYTKLAKVEKK